MSWRELAACRSMPVTDFYPEGSRSGCRPYTAARAACAGCPVVAACLAAALDEEREMFARGFSYRHGFRGGMTPTERAQFDVGWRELTCVVCAATFVAPRRAGAVPVTCSDLCAYDRRLQQQREHNERRPRQYRRTARLGGTAKRRKESAHRKRERLKAKARGAA